MISDPPTLIVTVPPPPSANRIWRKVPGRRAPMRSEQYNEWRTRAGWEAKMQLAVQGPTIPGAFHARIEVPKSRRDLDNWMKPLLDLCQLVGAVRNDSGARKIEIEPADRTDCLIALWDLGGPELPIPKIRRRAGKPPPKPRTVRYVAAKDPRGRAAKKGIRI